MKLLSSDGNLPPLHLRSFHVPIDKIDGDQGEDGEGDTDSERKTFHNFEWIIEEENVGKLFITSSKLLSGNILWFQFFATCLVAFGSSCPPLPLFHLLYSLRIFHQPAEKESWRKWSEFNFEMNFHHEKRAILPEVRRGAKRCMRRKCMCSRLNDRKYMIRMMVMVRIFFN